MATKTIPVEVDMELYGWIKEYAERNDVPIAAAGSIVMNSGRSRLRSLRKYADKEKKEGRAAARAAGKTAKAKSAKPAKKAAPKAAKKPAKKVETKASSKPKAAPAKAAAKGDAKPKRSPLVALAKKSAGAKGIGPQRPAINGASVQEPVASQVAEA